MVRKGFSVSCRKSSKPHEDIIGIRSQNRGSLAQGKNYLLSKFSSLNQKVRQTKSNVNISNLRKLGSFTKPDVKVNFLKPNLKVSLWKSDSSLETLETPVVDKVHPDSDSEGSDNDSFHSDDFLTNSKSDEDNQLADSLENVGQADYVLPSCGILASAPRLGSRSQSVSSTDMNISIHVPSEAQGGRSDCQDTPGPSAASAQPPLTKPIDVYCQQFVHDAQNKMLAALEAEPGSQEPHHLVRETSSNPSRAAETKAEAVRDVPSRPSRLEVQSAEPRPQLVPVGGTDFAKAQKSPGSLSANLETGLHGTPSPADSSSRAVSPFAKIRSSMVQVANITQAGLTQGINFAVARVQKSPAEPEAVNEIKQKELKEMFTQCQTRIIQI